jgi:hypothetical protein
VLACGYSLLRFSPTGAFEWQKWPLGDTHVRHALIARDGMIYTSAGNTLFAMGTRGDVVWKIETGWNRYIHRIGVTPSGDFVFRTSQAEMHTRGSVRIYYEPEPAELFVVTRAGKIVERTKLAHDAKWPATIPWDPALRAGRI